MRGLFRFPNPVNETSARLVAGGVVLMSVLFLVLRDGWVLVPLTYGFVARVLTGPTLSPLGQLVTRVITPRLPIEPTLVPGPPKRFAQGIGAFCTLAASGAWLAGAPVVSYLMVGMIVVAASLEAFVGVCLGCTIFGWLMRRGAIPASTCRECNDISARLAASSAAKASA